jgi:hypothetical protein
MHGPLGAFELHTRGSSTPAVFEVVFMRNGETMPLFWGTADVEALPFVVATLKGTTWLVAEHAAGTFAEWRSAGDNGQQGDNFRLDLDGTILSHFERSGAAVGLLPEPFRAAALEMVKGMVSRRWNSFFTAAEVEKLLGGDGIREGIVSMPE